ncbi:DUF3265 domain-containing protein [Aeromonas hydrophila]|nr:DUF3265 domain-containing protein [Aeromonas hydrophila]
MHNNLRVLFNAWNFYHALRLVCEVACSSIGIALPTSE